MTEESIVILQDTPNAGIRGPAQESVSKFDNRRKKPWEVFKKQANSDEQAEQVVQFDSFRDKCQVNLHHNGDDAQQPYKLNRNTYLQNGRNNNNNNNNNNNSNHSENGRGWKGKGEKDFKSLNKTEPKLRQPQGPNRFAGKNEKNGYKKGENENNNSVNMSAAARGMSASSFPGETASQNSNNSNSNGSSAWPSFKNFNQQSSASTKSRFVNNNNNNASETAGNNTNFKDVSSSNRDDRKLKRFDKQQPKQQQQQQRDIEDSFSNTNEDSLSPSQKQQSPQEKQLFKKRQKICGSWVRVADKQKLDRPPSYQDYLGKLTQGLDQKKTFSIKQSGEYEEEDSDQMIADLEDGEIELQGDNSNLNRSAGFKAKSTFQRTHQTQQQQQQPRGFTGNSSKNSSMEEQAEFNEEIDEGMAKKKKIKQEENSSPDGQGKSNDNNADASNIADLPEPFQVLQKMDQLGNEIIKNKKGNQNSLQVQQTIAAQQDAFLQQYFNKQKKADSSSSNLNPQKGQKNFKTNNSNISNEDANTNRNNGNNYGSDNGQSTNSNGAGHRKEKRFDIENYRVDFEKNMIDHNVNITEGLKNLVKIQNQLYVQTHAKKEEMKEAAAVAKRVKHANGSSKEDEDDDLNQFEKFNDEYLKKQEQMLEEIAKRNKEKVNQIKNSSGQKDSSRDYQGLSTHQTNSNYQQKNGKESVSEDAEETMNPLEKLISEELERNRQDKQAQSYRLLELQKLHQTHNPIQVEPKIMQPYHHEPKQGQGSVTSQQLQIMAQAKCESGASRKRPSKFSDIPLPPVPIHDTMAQLERLRQMTQFSSQGPSAFASFPKLTPMQAFNGVPHIQGMNFQANSFVSQQIPLPQSLSGINSLSQLQKTLFANNSKNFSQQIKQTPADNSRKVPSPKTIQEAEITPATVAPPPSSSQGNNGLEIPLPQSHKSSVVSKLNTPSVTKINLPAAQSTNNSVIPAPSSASVSVAKSAPLVQPPKQIENPFAAWNDHEKIEIPEAIKNKQKHMKPALYEKVVSDYIKMHKQAKEELAKKDEGALQKSKDPRRRAQMVQALSAEQIAIKAVEEISKSIMEIEADSQQFSEESLIPLTNSQTNHTSSQHVLGFSVATDEMRQLNDNNNIVYNYKLLKGEKRMLSQEQNLLEKHQQRCLQEAELLHASKSSDLNNESIIREEDTEQNLNDLYKDDKEIRYFRENLSMCCMRCGQNGHYARWCPQQPEEITQCLFCLGNHSREYCNSFVCFKCYSVGHRVKDCAFDLSLDQARCRLCRKKGHTYRSCGVLQVELPQKSFDQASLQNTICLNCGGEGHVNCFDSTLYLSYDGLYKIDKETLDKIA